MVVPGTSLGNANPFNNAALSAVGSAATQALSRFGPAGSIAAGALTSAFAGANPLAGAAQAATGILGQALGPVAGPVASQIANAALSALSGQGAAALGGAAAAASATGAAAAGGAVNCSPPAGGGGTSDAQPGGPQGRANTLSKEKLLADPEFKAQYDAMVAKYGPNFENQVWNVIQGESNFNPTTQTGSYNGLFQLSPSEAGVSSASQILNATPAEQLRMYDNRLTQLGYNGSQNLGVLQASPAYANKPDNFVAYQAGSAAARANANTWGRYSNAGGAITIGGIKAYYATRGF